MRDHARAPAARADLQAELVRVLRDGLGIVVLPAGFAPAQVVDTVSKAFNAMLRAEKAAGSGSGSGDHSTPPGANERFGRAQQTLAKRSPEA